MYPLFSGFYCLLWISQQILISGSRWNDAIWITILYLAWKQYISNIRCVL